MAVISLVIMVIYRMTTLHVEYHVGTAYIKPKSRFTIVGVKNHWKLLSAAVPVNIGINLENKFIAENVPCKTVDEGRICLEWGDKAKLDISVSNSISKEEPVCHTIEWISLSNDFTPMDCTSTAHVHWYGRGALFHQRWPVQQGSVKMQPFVSNAINKVKGEFGAILDRYWVSSTGVGIFVEESVPLHVSINETLLCLKSEYDNSPYANPDKQKSALNHTICVKYDVKSIHKYMSNRLWKKPTGIPHERLFKEPIWSTSADTKNM